MSVAGYPISSDQGASSNPISVRVWPGNTALPDFVLADAREVVGELNADHLPWRPGIWNDINSPPPVRSRLPDALRCRPVLRRALSQPVRVADGDGVGSGIA